MFRSTYRHEPGKPRHGILETVESTIEKHLEKPKPDFIPIEIPYDVRKRHMYVIGKTQHGKSTLLQSIISQDIGNGAGVCVLDPKPSGERPNLVESLLQHIPPDRKDDVIYFSGKDPIPIDVMSWETEQERQTLAADIMQTFMQFSTSKEGDRWQSVLRHLVHTLLEAGDCTFLDIHDFLVDEDGKRKEILARVKNPNLLKYWTMTFKRLPHDAAAPIITRMATFVLVPPINTMLGTLKPKLKIEDVIRGRKILLVDLTGAGKESGNLIGTLIVSKIQQAVFRRLRTPFHLFADEFQNFQTSAFDVILSESGSLGLRLTLANQYASQLEDRIRQSVFGNVSTFFVFNIDDADTRYFKSKVPPDYDYQRLATLPPFRALYHIAGQVPVIKSTPQPVSAPTDDQLAQAESIKERTLREYGCKSTPPPYSSNDGAVDPPAPETPKPPKPLPPDQRTYRRDRSSR